MEDRRTLIADSAIEVIAREGVRALTHRSVDAEAGLASGSTSYYCRTRAQLIALTVERLVALLRGFVEHSEIQQVRPTGTRDLVELLVEMETGLLANYRGELAARHALIVELSGTEDTTDLVSSLLDPSDLAGALDAVDVKNADDSASRLLVIFEGLLWERTFGRLSDEEVDTDRDSELLGTAIGESSRSSSRGGLFGIRL